MVPCCYHALECKRMAKIYVTTWHKACWIISELAIRDKHSNVDFMCFITSGIYAKTKYFMWYLDDDDDDEASVNNY